ncbi:hypothetical protein SAMN05421852_105106 [Thermoflavimicrobium dichotomicum]|uniref:Uncharacterized protein n=1 Tax=Thermoflavimicrobium dichotomicum TaxID=46223 RepID=A0A1I3P6H4_9BACL|nr:hypothetical protein SAMN05421852_105106 [Thermoflavimicrobium dichotomicum]
MEANQIQYELRALMNRTMDHGIFVTAESEDVTLTDKTEFIFNYMQYFILLVLFSLIRRVNKFYLYQCL